MPTRGIDVQRRVDRDGARVELEGAVRLVADHRDRPISALDPENHDLIAAEQIGFCSLGRGIAATFMATGASAENVRIVLVVKALGIGLFDGVEEVAQEFGDVQIIFTGPIEITANGRIEVIISLVAQCVDVIADSTIDTDALVSALKKAIDRGIMVIG